MKKKSNIKILLPIVIVIWGLLIYRIVATLDSDEQPLLKTTRTAFIAPKIQKKDTFSLLPIESDPFLGTLYKMPKVKNTGAKTSKKPILVWPTIQYRGIVSDKNGKASIYILTINGNEYLLKKGDTIQQIKVVKGTNKNVHIRFKGQTKEFMMI